MTQRNTLPEYGFFAAALSLQAQTGGGLTATLETLADIIRRRVAMKERGHALSSEARTSSMVLGALPVAVGGMLYIVAPQYIDRAHDPGRGGPFAGDRDGRDAHDHPQEPVVNPLLLITLAAVRGVVLPVAAWLMPRVSDRDLLLAARLNAARGTWIKPDSVEAPPARSIAKSAQGGLAAIGQAVMRSGLLPGRTRLELSQTLASSGFRGPSTLPLFLGAKLVLMAAVPIAAWGLAGLLGRQPSTRLMMAAGFVAGLLAPDMIVRRFRKSHLSRLEEGVPDALGLLVICAQAGLSLEPAMARVAAEMRIPRPGR